MAKQNVTRRHSWRLTNTRLLTEEPPGELVQGSTRTAPPAGGGGGSSPSANYPFYSFGL